MAKLIQFKEGNELVYPTFIVDKATNSNGTYIKYADGTMICRHTVLLSSPYNQFTSVYGSIYHASSRYTWTYPMEFIDTPEYVNASMIWGGIGGMPLNSKSPTNAQFWQWNAVQNSTATIYANMIAIGKWK